MVPERKVQVHMALGKQVGVDTVVDSILVLVVGMAAGNKRAVAGMVVGNKFWEGKVVGMVEHKVQGKLGDKAILVVYNIY